MASAWGVHGRCMGGARGANGGFWTGAARGAGPTAAAGSAATARAEVLTEVLAAVAGSRGMGMEGGAWQARKAVAGVHGECSERCRSGVAGGGGGCRRKCRERWRLCTCESLCERPSGMSFICAAIGLHIR
eukprot:scaffold40165_cov60-Phaeocystis_antarctica.AAC.9